MSSNSQKLLELLGTEGEQSADQLYVHFKDPSRVRRLLRALIDKDQVIISKRVKLTDGPGRPMNFYKLAD